MLYANRHLAGPTSRQAADRAGDRLLEGFAAFAAGEPGTTVSLLTDIRPEAHAVGGSHAHKRASVVELVRVHDPQPVGELAQGQQRVAAAAARQRAFVRDRY